MALHVSHERRRDAVGAIWDAIVARWRAAQESRRNRREYQELLRADPRILRDIGVTKEEVQFALEHWKDTKT